MDWKNTEIFEMIAEKIDRFAEPILLKNADAEFCGKEKINEDTLNEAEEK